MRSIGEIWSEKEGDWKVQFDGGAVITYRSRKDAERAVRIFGLNVKQACEEVFGLNRQIAVLQLVRDKAILEAVGAMGQKRFSDAYMEYEREQK